MKYARFVAAMALGAAGFAGSPMATGTAAAPDRVPRASHVFVIVGENTSLGQLTAANTPYIAGTLRPRSAWLDGYDGLARSGSLGDYIEMTSGQLVKCERANSDPKDRTTHRILCRQDVNNIFNQLQRHGISWADWQESMPNACGFYDSGSDATGNHYVVHHNPAVYYQDIAGTWVCRHHNLPMGTTSRNNTAAFDRRLARGNVPRFNFIVPNACEDGHEKCGDRPKVSQFDAFVKREVHRIKASPAWDSSSVIVVTWDEHGGEAPGDLRVGSIWFGARVKPGAYSGRWTHAGLLRTLEDMMRLRHIHGARTATPIASIWK